MESSSSVLPIFFLVIIVFCGICSTSQSSKSGITRDSCLALGATNPPVCEDCTKVLDCRQDPAGEENCGSCGMVCGDARGFAACYKGYDDLAAGSITNYVCLCRDSGGLGLLLPDGIYADPFDSIASYVTCTGGVPSYSACSPGTVFDSSSETCIPGAECPDGYPGSSYEIPLNCNSYIDCITGAEKACVPNTEIFDITNIGGTPDQCIDPKADACIDSAAAGSIFVVSDVCYLYATCNAVGSGDIINANCCPRGQYYDIVTFACVPDAGGCSQSVGLCIQEFWAQEYCNECITDTTAYATRATCSEYYYDCEDEGSGLKPQLTQCPSSFPIWDPINDYCDLEANVAECT